MKTTTTKMQAEQVAEYSGAWGAVEKEARRLCVASGAIFKGATALRTPSNAIGHYFWFSDGSTLEMFDDGRVYFYRDGN